MKDKSMIPWKISKTVKYIKILCQKLNDIRFSHINRIENKVADWAVSFACMERNNFIMTENYQENILAFCTVIFTICQHLNK